MDKVHARIDSEEFQALVAGRPIAVAGRGDDGSTVSVHLILADIGLAKMIQLVVEAVRDPEAEPCIIPPTLAHH